MTSIAQESLLDVDDSSIRGALGTLLGGFPSAIDTSDEVLIVPEAHYPFHPSTGMVTNPTVVGSLVDLLEADAAIGLPGSQYVDAAQTAQYLGYERLVDETGVRLLYLDSVDCLERRVRFVDRQVRVSVPEPFQRASIVVVPTLRRSDSHRISGGMVTLARAVTDDPTREDVLAASRACWPSLAILDATYAYDGEPDRRRLLLASDDVVGLEEKAAELLDVAPRSVPHLSRGHAPPTPIARVRETLEDTGTSSGDDLLARGYRTYARLTGDLVPPQLLPRSEEE